MKCDFRRVNNGMVLLLPVLVLDVSKTVVIIGTGWIVWALSFEFKRRVNK